jgi:GH24 family phage-related lysozyme (muramidase)
LNKYTALKNRIKKNEGFRLSVYRDSLGFNTIGYGHLIKKNEKHFFKNKFKKTELLKVFNKDFENALQGYEGFYKNEKHNKNIKEVLIEMIFQLGIKKQIKFIKMNHYIKKNLIFMAALEMKKSLWYLQTPKRVDGLIKILLKQKNE